jgi:hypothetical protein
MARYYTSKRAVGTMRPAVGSCAGREAIEDVAKLDVNVSVRVGVDCDVRHVSVFLGTVHLPLTSTSRSLTQSMPLSLELWLVCASFMSECWVYLLVRVECVLDLDALGLKELLSPFGARPMVPELLC